MIHKRQIERVKISFVFCRCGFLFRLFFCLFRRFMIQISCSFFLNGKFFLLTDLFRNVLKNQKAVFKRLIKINFKNIFWIADR